MRFLQVSTIWVGSGSGARDVLGGTTSFITTQSEAGRRGIAFAYSAGLPELYSLSTRRVRSEPELGDSADTAAGGRRSSIQEKAGPARLGGRPLNASSSAGQRTFRNR